MSDQTDSDKMVNGRFASAVAVAAAAAVGSTPASGVQLRLRSAQASAALPVRWTSLAESVGPARVHALGHNLACNGEAHTVIIGPWASIAARAAPRRESATRVVGIDERALLAARPPLRVL